MSTVVVALILLVVLVVFLAVGAWIPVAIAVTSWIGLVVFSDHDALVNLANAWWSSSASYTLASLPLFVWMGEILFRTKLSEQMFSGLSPWLNWLPGRLMHVNILGCGIFGSVSGSSAATCATIAKSALPELTRRGYDERITLGSLATAGTLGILIPPSITMVVYAVSADVSIIRVFLAGFLPGLLLMLLFSGYIVVWALLNPTRVPPAETFGWRSRLASIRQLMPCIVLIAFITWIMMAGYSTATEAAAYGVVASLALAWMGGSLTRRAFWDSLMSATRLTAMIMFVLGATSFLSVTMSFTGIPRALAEWVAALHLSPWALIGVLTIIYIILGTALDGISMIALTTATVLPMVQQAGFDLVWFGIFIVLLVEIAEVTPPVGFNLFVLQSMTGKDSNYIARVSLPFFMMMVLAIAIVTVWPAVVTWLPDVVMAKELK
ncbi:C4-dicarboxylate TRAP transporter large permease protein DctM [Cupriavidus campinensis]|uniref:TRAP transporter large permease protein n=1 Tax=Cupriavidus campinensis TaxID=151783 RepID=A0AAE9L343_9BURK|nr:MULTISPECIES: TRAP transporter large permease subunit [Cupriavidus]TSP14416.1 TRAP transporter large permease subunit [Cupriavidus campinensis]URF05548.1 TRAP transporter large permease subunit [Cupriavidus campinensis]CAG2146411.1 C4-dicarboxylate TRAP transporter large permease protein DctM [Cupriavidus campinensis]